MNDIHDQFDHAGDRLNDLLDEMEGEGLNAGAVIGGALTAIVFRLIVSSPDANTAIGMISSAMASGARLAVEYEQEYDEDDDGVRH